MPYPERSEFIDDRHPEHLAETVELLQIDDQVVAPLLIRLIALLSGLIDRLEV
jgi:hypothetical protein